MSGSAGLERAIRWAEAKLVDAEHQNVRVQPVQVDKWVRGEESLKIVPSGESLAMLGLGGSVGTGAEPLAGELLIVSDWADFEAKKSRAKDRIVLFDVKLGVSELSAGMTRSKSELRRDRAVPVARR